MKCNNCGAESENKNFCPQCGAQLVQTASADVRGGHTQVLVFGILGLALGFSSGILGLIFSIIALKKANQYIEAYGDVSSQVNIGKKLAIAGLIVSIIVIIVGITLIVLGIIWASHATPSDWRELASTVESYASLIDR